jgi:putative hydrolase of the HAD superfamily
LTPPVGAVVFDLFGTLVAAPTPAERTAAAARLPETVGCGTEVVDRHPQASWQARHSGTPESDETRQRLGRSSKSFGRERPPTYADTRAVDRVIPQLDGASLRVRRNDALSLTIVLDADQPGSPALVWYVVVGGPCLGDTWQ